MHWKRIFGEIHPYESITWERRTAKITKGDGKVVFEQHNIEVPNFWSQTATDIVASKYFRGKLNSPERETSVKQMIDRVAMTIGKWGLKDGYFASEHDAGNFILDLTWLLVNQYASFNSPVWFNVGIHERPQCSACFILSVEDHMDSILQWYRDEGKIFQRGSGAGINLSKLRGSMEPLSRGGFSSGPVSFMKGADGVANSIRSGGETRRAAKMVVLDVDHPDIKDFIYCKKMIEDMTKALAQSGIKDSIAAEIFDPYTLLPYQNANNSVRVTDEFMRAVEENRDWHLTARVTGKAIETVKAKEIMDWICDAAWYSADPGMQYDTTINEWHTCSNTGRINASNPCSEYMHLDNSACNLASLNLIKFLKEGAKFDVELFRQAVDAIILAQEIVVDNSSYPTEKITENAKAYRELGLGYANLGALLMILGYPYDSEMGRFYGGHITSLMCGEAYRMSALVADMKGPFSGYFKNQDPMLKIISKHLEAGQDLFNISQSYGMGDHDLQEASRQVWHEALELGRRYGVRNSQVTVIAPTGTISFMMDCATTGIEPELALVKYKKLVGGGILKLVNNQVPLALRRLGYANEQTEDISNYILEKETIEGAPHLREEDLAVFDCSFKAANGQRSIHHMGHVKMMAAVQPFVSGAISKTINLPSNATIDDVREVYMQGWKLGLKAVALYRDGCKSIQPLNTKKEEEKEIVDPLLERHDGYARRKLPDERPALTHKFDIGGHRGYLTVGLYPDNHRPGELFVTIAKEGSTVSGLFDAIARLTSICLQSGVPLKTLVKWFKDTRFEPSGFTNNPDIPTAKSIVDYLFSYLGMKYLSDEDKIELFGPDSVKNDSQTSLPLEKVTPQYSNDSLLSGLVGNGKDHAAVPKIIVTSNVDAPVCKCGTLMVRAGACYSCPNCFATTGVCN